MGQRISQEVAEVLVAGGTQRISQEVVEALARGGVLRASQEVIEALAAGGVLHTSQIVVEVLVPNIGVFMPIVYPDLPGLEYPIGWYPKFFNLKTQQMVTGSELDLGTSNYPIHYFELSYSVLRDGFLAPGSSEWRTMAGFYGQLQGNLGRFLFNWTDDNTVQSQFIATTDGTSHLWTLQRTFGAGGYGFTEPVGYVDLTRPFRAYFDGVLQDSSSYSVLTTEPGLQQIQFNATPGAGKALTVDMSYFYYCKFPDSDLPFSKFMNRLWELKKVKFNSCKANT